MLIYQNSTNQFINDVRNNVISDIMQSNFISHYGWRPAPNEVTSWQNSLSRVRDLIEIASLNDNYIALEYEIPYNQDRIDCLLFGHDADKSPNIVLIELKQWSSVKALDEEGNFVETIIGSGPRKVAHPSEQVEGYHNYLKQFIAEFDKDPIIKLFSCAYCHNYKKTNDGLYDSIYKDILKEFPVYSKEDAGTLAQKIKELLCNGLGLDLFNRFMTSQVLASKKLLDHVAAIIENDFSFSLINEQIVAKNEIWSRVKRSIKNNEKNVIIVKGGPGTGKSVIALNVLAEAAKKRYQVFYACKSKPFLNGIKNLVGTDSKYLFSNLIGFLPTKVNENQIDLLLIDEAHRIEVSSNSRFTKKDDRTDMPQVEQLIRCAKTSVFFIDDKQNVRFSEIGSSDIIKKPLINTKQTFPKLSFYHNSDAWVQMIILNG